MATIKFTPHDYRHKIGRNPTDDERVEMLLEALGEPGQRQYSITGLAETTGQSKEIVERLVLANPDKFARRIEYRKGSSSRQVTRIA